MKNTTTKKYVLKICPLCSIFVSIEQPVGAFSSFKLMKLKLPKYLVSKFSRKLVVKPDHGQRIFNTSVLFFLKSPKLDHKCRNKKSL